MKICRVIPLVALLGGSYAAEPVAPAPPIPGPAHLTQPKPMVGPAWLGFKVARPDDATRSRLPGLPVGMGFVIQSVDPKSPAESSGVRPLDVVWKFGDQMLVNEGQLGVLLRTKKPGDVVTLALFRNEQEMEVSLTLGAFPLNREAAAGPLMEQLLSPQGNGMARVIDHVSHTASLTDETGAKAALKRLTDGSGYELEIRNSAGEVVFNENLSADCDVSKVPEAWRGRVAALRKGLDGSMESPRQPRPRVVPPTASGN